MVRPFGVTLLASFFFVQSIVNIIIVYTYYKAGAPLFPVVYFTFDSIAGVVLAYGLWKGHIWGKIGTMILSGVEILIGFLGTIISLDLELTSPTQAVTKFFVYSVVIYFLTRPEISEYFKK